VTLCEVRQSPRSNCAPITSGLRRKAEISEPLGTSHLCHLQIPRIVLLPLEVGLHIGGRHQPHGVTQCLELARPMLHRAAGFDTDQTWRQLLEERQDVATLQLPANNHRGIARSGPKSTPPCNIQLGGVVHLRVSLPSRPLSLFGTQLCPPPFARLWEAVWRLRPSNHQKNGVVMSIIPLDVQRRCERRWAARFSRPTESVAPRNQRSESDGQQIAAADKSKRKTRRREAAGR
jgi:hypothetical protein